MFLLKADEVMERKRSRGRKKWLALLGRKPASPHYHLPTPAIKILKTFIGWGPGDPKYCWNGAMFSRLTPELNHQAQLFKLVLKLFKLLPELVLKPRNIAWETPSLSNKRISKITLSTELFHILSLSKRKGNYCGLHRRCLMIISETFA